jgi:predicted 3-demethylubiquinone-9 3-methyltransferase (glyoxalase superfamily)
MNRIAPFLWYDDKAEEAANLYVSIFGDSKITGTTRGPDGAVMSVTFQLEGQDFYALNGGPHFTFSPAVSFFVNCETQEEVDDLWEKLSAGGETQQCGWLKDKFGLSWQIIPKVLGAMLRDRDPEKSKRVMEAMLKMVKLDVAELTRAYEGR